MFCTSCGARIPDDSKFCPYCGQQVQPKIVNNSSSKRPDYTKNPYEEALKQDIQPEPMEFEEPVIEQSDYGYEEKPVYQENETVGSSFDKFAKLCFLFGLLGLLLGSIPLCIVSLAFSRKGLNSPTYSYKAKKGRVLAIIGIVVSAILLVVYFFFYLDFLSNIIISY